MKGALKKKQNKVSRTKKTHLDSRQSQHFTAETQSTTKGRKKRATITMFQTLARKSLPQLRGESACQREPTTPAHHHPAVGKQEPVVEFQDCTNKRTTVCLYTFWSNTFWFFGEATGAQQQTCWIKTKESAITWMWKPLNVRRVWMLMLPFRQNCRRGSSRHGGG